MYILCIRWYRDRREEKLRSCTIYRFPPFFVCVFFCASSCFWIKLRFFVIKKFCQTRHTTHYTTKDESYHVRWHNLEYKDICVCVYISNISQKHRGSVQRTTAVWTCLCVQTGQIVLFSNDNLYSIAIAKNRNYFDSKNSIKCSDVRVVVVKVYCEVRVDVCMSMKKKLLEKDKCMGKLGVCVFVCVRLNSPGRSLTRDWLFSFE